MQLATNDGTRVRFGAFEADLQTEELSRSGRRLRLPKQSFVVLAMLLKRPGQLVTRDELRQRLWPRETFIEYDQALNAAVNRLREALGDSADSPTYIETLPRRGYRFVGTMEAHSVSQSDATMQPAATPEIAPDLVPAAQSKSPLRGRWMAVIAVSAVLILATVVFAYTYSHRELGAQLSLRPLTTLPGREVAPTFSPDGSQLAFAWNGGTGDSQGFDLYVKGIDSEHTLQLTRHPARWITPAWSPDGRQIAFARQTDTDTGIFVVSVPGGEERRLASVFFTHDALIHVSWSPDGQRLLYSAANESSAQSLYVLSLDSLTTTPLPTSVQCWHTGSAAWSPDGLEIAFVCITSVAVYSIYAMPASGGQPRKLASVMGNPKGLSWSADGSHVLFASDAGDGGGLWEVSREGKDLERTAFGEEAAMPAVSVHTAQVAYARERQVIDIWRADLQAAPAQQSAMRLISSTRIQMTPQYSPDGTRIAFQSNRTGSSEIWTTDADGANPVRITAFNGPQTGAPSWCADGKRVAFDSRASGVSAVYIADINERLPRMVRTSVQNLALPAWSGDCRWLIASDGDESLYLVPATGGPAQRFTQRPSYLASISGDRVVFNVKNVRVTLWEKHIGSAAERPLEGMPELAYSDSWVTTRDGVYFTFSQENPRLVRFYDFNTRAVRDVMTLVRAPTPAGGLGLSVSPDRRWLLYSQTEDYQSDLMLISGLH